MKKSILAILFVVGFMGCAHDIKPVTLPAEANPINELESLSADRSEALSRQADVLAPKDFTSADEYYTKAREANEQRADRDKVLEDISYAKAYLDRANSCVDKANSEIPEVVKARQAALVAGAQQLPDRLAKIDKALKSDANKIADGKTLAAKEVSRLEKRYLDLELVAIKTAKLSEARNMLEVAKKRDAEKSAPKSYAMAVQMYNAADQKISSDRHNTDAVDEAAGQATVAAQKVLTILDNIKFAKNETPEQQAMELTKRDEAVVAANQSQNSAAKTVQQRDQELNKQQIALVAAQQDKKALEKKESFNQVLEDARSEFSADDADVYRQGNNLIIRLKSIEFASGRADLPAKSLPVLNKVEDVVRKLEAKDVVVQGHTDGVGSAALNKKLSAERAASVAEFLVASRTLPAAAVTSVGYGFAKPIASNKTAEGRAQNRRVDIVITPSTDTE